VNGRTGSKVPEESRRPLATSLSRQKPGAGREGIAEEI
jgi:hypothetical protein